MPVHSEVPNTLGRCDRARRARSKFSLKMADAFVLTTFEPDEQDPFAFNPGVVGVSVRYTGSQYQGASTTRTFQFDRAVRGIVFSTISIRYGNGQSPVISTVAIGQLYSSNFSAYLGGYSASAGGSGGFVGSCTMVVTLDTGITLTYESRGNGMAGTAGTRAAFQFTVSMTGSLIY